LGRLEIHLAPWFIAMMVVLGLMSCGLVPVVMWLFALKHYPTAIDEQGVTLRGGELLPWSGLTKVHKTVVVRGGSSKWVSVVDLHFGAKMAKLAPQVFKEGYGVLDHAGRMINQDLRAPE
jgi:hypothetical protein